MQLYHSIIFNKFKILIKLNNFSYFQLIIGILIEINELKQGKICRMKKLFKNCLIKNILLKNNKINDLYKKLIKKSIKKIVHLNIVLNKINFIKMFINSYEKKNINHFVFYYL